MFMAFPPLTGANFAESSHSIVAKQHVQIGVYNGLVGVSVRQRPRRMNELILIAPTGGRGGHTASNARPIPGTIVRLFIAFR